MRLPITNGWKPNNEAMYTGAQMQMTSSRIHRALRKHPVNTLHSSDHGLQTFRHTTGKNNQHHIRSNYGFERHISMMCSTAAPF